MIIITKWKISQENDTKLYYKRKKIFIENKIYIIVKEQYYK